MKSLALLTLAAALLPPAHATTNTGVSIGIDAPSPMAYRTTLTGCPGRGSAPTA